MDRAVVIRDCVGLFSMQVCAANDATDEEILRVCNSQNPAGGGLAWNTVIRHVEQHHEDNLQTRGKRGEPVVCEDDPNRTHFLVGC